MLPAQRPRTDGSAPRPIKRGAKVAEALAQEIVHEIVSRKLPPGTLLSSEAQMLEDYGVGRGSLREALRILEVHGLITMKPGRNGGPMVIEVGTRDYGRMSTLFFHLGGMTFQQLIEARLVLEPMMARLAAERRGQELVGALADPDRTRVEDDATYYDATTDFHRGVASMSGNPVLNLLSVSLEDIFRDQVTGLLSPKDERRHVLEVHAAIAQAIADGDAEAAERLMHDHMQEYADWVRKKHPQLMDQVIDWR
ncbi:FadR/GntR family transcriptional regulator [Geodermatophilus marinus]|uniref:FadR/GntR family transcriptional regulator n=1 Tax=Geodermatophilus sp. LHW52908 TaxID=2303986 RepID=UPI000E3CE692|nr:FadR/GntR family transcriptional regulator [Geodermatophilus sp. LHW52908]RFU19538.1 FadR family transcriptional regulator [Geodermatophilus sp. LHW52908]